MDRKFVLAALCAFVVAFVLGFLFHGVLLFATTMRSRRSIAVPS